MPAPSSTESGGVWMELVGETVRIAKRVRRTLVRAERTTRVRDVLVEQELVRESVNIQRIPIGRVVDRIPPIREEDDIIVVPVVEEELVTIRRLILKEEVHLRRTRSIESHTEVVAVREQQVVVTRTAVDVGLASDDEP